MGLGVEKQVVLCSLSGSSGLALLPHLDSEQRWSGCLGGERERERGREREGERGRGRERGRDSTEEVSL